MNLRRMCILLVLGWVFYKFQLDQVDWQLCLLVVMLVCYFLSQVIFLGVKLLNSQSSFLKLMLVWWIFLYPHLFICSFIHSLIYIYHGPELSLCHSSLVPKWYSIHIHTEWRGKKAWICSQCYSLKWFRIRWGLISLN